MRLFFLISAIAYILFSTSSCGDEIKKAPQSSISDTSGIFGFVSVYDKYGDESPSIGVVVEAQRLKTMSGETVNETIATETNEDGFFEFIECEGGTYNITFKKEGYINNMLYDYIYDTLYADTLSTLYLSQVPPATIELTNIIADSIKFEITRKVYFTDSRSQEYPVVTRYFIDTLPTVSKDKYIVQFISGASFGSGGTSNELVITKTHNFIISNSDPEISSPKTIYICAYPENYRFYEYIIPISDNNSRERSIFPTLGAKSNVISFEMDTTMIPDYNDF